jgi:glycosyltransferase involved in cell wall biosynthesis
MPAPLASILINNYNYGRFLGQAIDSALSQDYVSKEILVVDDGPTDNSREIIFSYGDRIIPISKENGGQASALTLASHPAAEIFYASSMPTTSSLLLSREDHPCRRCVSPTSAARQSS